MRKGFDPTHLKLQYNEVKEKLQELYADLIYARHMVSRWNTPYFNVVIIYTNVPLWHQRFHTCVKWL